MKFLERGANLATLGRDGQCRGLNPDHVKGNGLETAGKIGGHWPER
jgi:hypothetical protein